MDMNDYDQLMGTRLKEEMLDVAKQNINNIASVITVAQTVLVDLDFTCDTFTV